MSTTSARSSARSRRWRRSTRTSPRASGSSRPPPTWRRPRSSGPDAGRGDQRTPSLPAGDRHLMAEAGPSPGLDLESLTKSVRRRSPPSTTSTLDDPAAGRSSPCSGPRAAARPRRCGWSPGWRSRRAGRILLGEEDVTEAKPYKRPVNTVFQSYALFPHLDIFENVAFGLRRRRAADVRGTGRRGARAGRARPLRPAQAVAALRRPAAAGRAGPGHRQPARGAAARRAARRARPQAAPADAARAQADPDRGRPHVRARHPRSGGGHDDGRHDRGDEQRPDRAARLAGRPVRVAGQRVRGQLPRAVQPAAGRGRGLGAWTWSWSTSTGPGSRCRRSAAGPTPGTSWSAYGRRRSTWRSGSAAAAVNALPAGIVVDASFTGISTQYVVGLPSGMELSAFAQNTGRAAVLPVGTRVDGLLAAGAHVRTRRRRGCRGRDRDRGRRAAADRRRAGRRARDRRAHRLAGAPGMSLTAAAAGTRVAGPPEGAPEEVRRGRRLTPYLLLLPGLAWLVLFFAVPVFALATMSLQTRVPGAEIGVYSRRSAGPTTPTRSPSTPRSSSGRSATRRWPRCCAWSIGYPLAYAIALRAGRWRNLMLVAVIAPFFTCSSCARSPGARCWPTPGR